MISKSPLSATKLVATMGITLMLLLLGHSAKAQGLVGGFLPQDAPPATTPADVPSLIAASDKHFAAVEVGQVQPGDFKTWTEERTRLDTIAMAIKAEPIALVHAKIYRRLGVSNFALSRGLGSTVADGYFAQAEEVLDKLSEKGAIPQLQENRATIWKERADNLVMLGNEDQAHFYLEKALRAARASSYRDKLGEATVRERLAGLAFRRGQWQETLDCLGSAVAIMTNLAASQPGFDKNTLRMPLWYTAVATSRLKKDAEPEFGRFLTLVGRDITPHDEADVYREAALNVGERSPTEAGPARTAALRKANGYLLKAKQIIDTSTRDEDVLEKLAIYTDLGMSYARGGLGAEAEATFKSALEFAGKSPTVGNDSPALIPLLERYAALLKGLNRPQDAAAQLANARRIEKLHVK